MSPSKFLKVGASDNLSEIRTRLKGGDFTGIAVRIGSGLMRLTAEELEELFRDVKSPSHVTIDSIADRLRAIRMHGQTSPVLMTSPGAITTAIAGSGRSQKKPAVAAGTIKLRSFAKNTKSKTGAKAAATPGVLGIEESTAASPPSAWLAVEFENHDAQTPLQKDKSYVLSFMSRIGEHHPDETEIALDPGTFGSVLTIQLVGKDFRIQPPSQLLHVDADGRSLGRARFDVVPLKEGALSLEAIVLKDGNFVHHFTLKANAGNAEKGRVLSIAANVGRPLITQDKLQRRDLTLLIQEDSGGGGFSITAIKEVAVRGRLDVTATELAGRVSEARNALLAIVNTQAGGKPYVSGIDIPAGVHSSAMRSLAEQGFLLYQAIFFGPKADQQVQLIGTRLRELATTKVLDIQVVSDRFVVPWPLLYVADQFDATDIRPERFLGFSNRIEQIPLQTGWSVTDCEIKHRSDLAIGVNVNRDIDRTMGQPLVSDQLQFFDTVQRNGSARVTVRDSDAAIAAAFTNPAMTDQVMYCFCHAMAPKANQTADAASMRFESGTTISVRDLRLKSGTVPSPYQSAPLIFINACQSAQLSPLFYDGFVPYLLSRGARGVIGTECDTPAVFAKEFASRFFRKFLNGEDLGQVVLSLRQEFLRDHNNVMGLLYAVYCNGDTRVDPSLRLVA